MATGLLPAVLIGLVAGVHAATWGMYKDAVYEGFRLAKYVRSPLVAAGLAPVVLQLLRLDLARPGAVILLFGATYIAERALVEFHKTFLREEDQSKYFIPMALHVGGRVVRSRWLRRAAGAAYLAGIGAALTGLLRLDAAAPGLPRIVLVMAAGAAAGGLSAVGGAWKDAPLEGFHWFKFFRSPAIATGYALLLSPFTGNVLALALAALGFTVATIETWKKFGKPREAPGKFAGKPVRFPEMYRRRRPFVPLYLGIWTALVILFASALAETLAVAPAR